MKKLNIWDVLKNTNANLTISDWLSVDKAATKNLLDGIKTLRSRKQARTELAGGQINIAPMEIQDDTRNMLINRVDTGTTASSDLLFGDFSSSDEDDYTTEEDDQESSTTTSSAIITPFEDIGKYEELDPAYESKTYALYPYSINRILNNSPLKTMVCINDQMVEAIVDCGAATSVISASLCDRLNLKLTGDIVKVSPFDSVEKKACHIIRDVPITIGGYTRKEHCCVVVRKPDIIITKKLNLDPRKYRKEMSKDGRKVNVYPRKQEEYLILGNTFLNAYEMRINMATNILSFPIFGGINEAQVQCYSSEINPHTLEILSLETDKKTMNQVPYADELLETDKKEDVLLENGKLNLEKIPDYLKALVEQ
ncbi:hypothetical protein HMPREF1544_06346 [Mucor circinelloides 1006PhL]|uniref:Uncharacterized protein n=1 Tax=Mucor circinelloides f. circinelloides (strain 1006PhL) TaxID=1220926 RepID=S2J9J6_MUCC1|nr:hypothetical protein HMPREF1544_06346 [Mucor circinelloides 1006PhL]KAG1125177.1 hypothetical protein G6F42_008946 [Rhizopus arrhizus]